jgi:hypothetical protein
MDYKKKCYEERSLYRRDGGLFNLQSRSARGPGGQNYCCKKSKKAFGKIYVIDLCKIHIR